LGRGWDCERVPSRLVPGSYPANVPGEMGPNGIVGQSRSLGKSRPILRVTRSVYGASSANPARDSPQRTPPYCVPWRATASDCTRKARPEKCEGSYENHVYRGEAEGLLG